MNKKKLNYEKPAMKVVELRQRTMMLAGSNGSGTVNDYNWNEYEEE